MRDGTKVCCPFRRAPIQHLPDTRHTTRGGRGGMNPGWENKGQGERGKGTIFPSCRKKIYFFLRILCPVDEN